VACPSATSCLAVGNNASAVGTTVSLDPSTGGVSSGQSAQTISGTANASRRGLLVAGPVPAGGPEQLQRGCGLASTRPSDNRWYQRPLRRGLSVAHALRWGGRERFARRFNAGGVGVTVPLDPASGEISTGQSAQAIAGTVGLGSPHVPLRPCAWLLEATTHPRVCRCPSTRLREPWQAARASRPFSGTDQFNGVSCTSATECLAVGYDGASGPGQAAALDATTGAIATDKSVQDILGTFELMAVACPQSTVCIGVGDTSSGGGVAVLVDSKTGAVLSGQSVLDITAAGVISGVACPSADLCFGAGSNGTSEGAVADFGVPTPSVAPPEVTSVSPTTGPTSGDTTVTINGTGFTGVTSVSFGPDAGTEASVVSSTEITVMSPPEAAATRNIRVTTPAGTSSVVAGDEYVYVGPFVTSVAPTSGPTAGDSKVTVIGTGFTGAIKVSFGPDAGISLDVISSTKLTIVSPAQAAGTVNVKVTTPAETSPAVTGDQFTYT
jgi:hypothetical protein